jgi:hypothetical protein
MYSTENTKLSANVDFELTALYYRQVNQLLIEQH